MENIKQVFKTKEKKVEAQALVTNAPSDEEINYGTAAFSTLQET